MLWLTTGIPKEPKKLGFRGFRRSPYFWSKLETSKISLPYSINKGA